MKGSWAMSPASKPSESQKHEDGESPTQAISISLWAVVAELKKVMEASEEFEEALTKAEETMS